MSDELKVQVMLTAPVRVSFPQVFEPKVVMINGVAKGNPFYSARLVFPADHPEILGLRQTASKLLGLLKPGLDLKTLKPYEDFFWPFKSGAAMIAEGQARAAKKGVDYKGYEDYMAGCQTLFVKAAAKYPPQLSVFGNNKWVTLSPETRSEHRDRFYNGMLAVGSVTLAGVKMPTGGWGVTAYLNGLGAVEGVPGGDRIGAKDIAYTYVPTVTASSVVEDFVA